MILRTYALILLWMTAPVMAQEIPVELGLEAPDTVVAGNEFEVSFTLNKGELSDYSRFSQQLPEGFTASNIQSPNADFTFSEQRVRVIWLKLPPEQEITVRYALRSHERITGTLDLGGTFAYVEEGERQFIELEDTRQVEVLPNPAIDQDLVVDIADFKSIVGSEKTVEAPEGVYAHVIRQEPEVSGKGDVLVTLLVRRPEGTRYMKIEEYIPGGYLFEEVNSGGAVVSTSSQVARFIWMQPPREELFRIRYRLVPEAGKAQEELVMDGTLTYTENEKNRVTGIRQKEVDLSALNESQQLALLETGELPAAGAGQEPGDGSGETGGSERPGGSERMEQPGGETGERSVPGNRNQEETKKEEPAKQAVTRRAPNGDPVIDIATLAPRDGVYFRVQVAAVKAPYFTQVFFARYPVTRDVKVEKGGGWHRYTIGPYSSYEEAGAAVRRVESATPVEGAFVVAYRDGARVPVSEVR